MSGTDRDEFIGNEHVPMPSWEKKFNQIKILSISSLSNTSGKQTGQRRDKSFIHWGSELFEPSMIGQSKFTNHFLTNIKGIDEINIDYLRIPSAEIASDQEKAIQLDTATKESLNLIRSKGKAMGLVFEKKSEVADFFKNKKQYKTR